MNVLFTAKFNKDISKIADDDLLERIAEVIEDLENALSLSLVANVKKMKGYSGYYRIRIGDYRLGIYVEKNTIFIKRFAHRKNIYDIFP
jgi:mRNA interferase RelE/StbE